MYLDHTGLQPGSHRIASLSRSHRVAAWITYRVAGVAIELYAVVPELDAVDTRAVGEHDGAPW